MIIIRLANISCVMCLVYNIPYLENLSHGVFFIIISILIIFLLSCLEILCGLTAVITFCMLFFKIYILYTLQNSMHATLYFTSVFQNILCMYIGAIHAAFGL